MSSVHDAHAKDAASSPHRGAPGTAFGAALGLSQGAHRRAWLRAAGADARDTKRTAIDPEIVAQLFGRRRARDPLEELTTRGREVLSLMAEGRSNQGTIDACWPSSLSSGKRGRR